MREDLGESLATLAKFDVPLDQTTISIEALRNYNLGMKASANDEAASLPYLLRANQLDPDFAMAYLGIAISYANLNQPDRANEYYTKAFQLREHASLRERLEIESIYYSSVTGESDKAVETFQKIITNYHAPSAYGNLSMVEAEQGRYEDAAKLAAQALQIAPTLGGEAYQGSAESLLPLQRFDDVHQILHTAIARKVDTDAVHKDAYILGFLEGNSAAMSEHLQWLQGNPAYENEGLAVQAETEAFGGHFQRARELTAHATESARRVDSQESAADWQVDAAFREASVGNSAQAREYSEHALKLAPASWQVEVQAALAFALGGRIDRARSLMTDLAKRYPHHTLVQMKFLPTIRAEIALVQKKPGDAVADLRTTSAIELGNDNFATAISCLSSVYVRGQAYLAAGNGRAAAGEFQKIVDHNGIVWNCPTGALAHLGLGRASALEAKGEQGADADAARTRSLAAYQDFFELWKTADPDIPILRQAKAEYAKLQSR